MATDGVYNPDILRQLISYTPETGVMIWRPRPPEMFSGNARAQAASWNKRFAGKEAFPINPTRGYRSSTIFGNRVMAHRVAWCHFHGSAIPAGQYVDHINGDRSDNRISNLRLASASQNQANTEKAIGAIRGAVFHKATGKWQCSIKVHLGTFDTPEAAAQAYERAAKELHGRFYLPNGRRATVTRVL